MKRLALFIAFITLSINFFSCGEEETLPKPKAYLRLDYPSPNYKDIKTPLPFTFKMNSIAEYEVNSKIYGGDSIFGININYPTLKGTVYLTYKKVIKDNLRSLLLDAQNITQSHTVKADEIAADLFEDADKRVFGMFYEVGGNAASQSQFYVTDSINHFLNGSLYFYAKPNYDSILPAADYLKNDIRKIMESVRWE